MPVSNEPTERRTDWLNPHSKMNDQVTTKTQGTSEPYPDASGTGMCESTGPAGSLRCDGVVGLPALSSNDEDILSHTSRTGRYVTDEADAADLARRGLLYDHGAQKLAGGMHYYTLSAEGRAALRAHRLAGRPIPRQPEPNITSETRGNQAAHAH